MVPLRRLYYYVVAASLEYHWVSILAAFNLEERIIIYVEGVSRYVPDNGDIKHVQEYLKY